MDKNKKILQGQLPDASKIQLVFLGILTGVASGFVAVMYRYVLSELDTIRTAIYDLPISRAHLGMFLIAIVSALIISYLLKWAPFSGGSGIPQIRGEILGRLSMDPGPTLISKFLGGSLANFVGLSVGREGPSIQLGGLTAKIIAKVFKTDQLTSNYLMSAGASAGLAAAFNAPIAGTLFTLEELYGSFSHSLLLPSLVASITASYISFTLSGKFASFSFKVFETMEMQDIGWVILLGIFAGIVGISFNLVIEWTRRLFAWTKLKRRMILIIVFMLTVLVGLLYPDILGGGHHLVEHLVAAPYSLNSLLLLLVSKLLFTSISYNSGVQGGIFLPVLVLGALSGVIVYHFSGMASVYMINFIILGMVAVMTAVVRAPIMSIVLVMEMTGSFSHLIMLAVVALVAFLVAELLKIEPIYEKLYDNLMRGIQPSKAKKVDFMISAVKLSPDFAYFAQAIKDLEFPSKFIIVEIEREGQLFLPQGSDSLNVQDTLFILHDQSDTEQVYEYFAS